MIDKVIQLVQQFWDYPYLERQKNSSKFIAAIEQTIAKSGYDFEGFLQYILQEKSSKIMPYIITIGHWTTKQSSFLSFVHAAILATWNGRQEEMAHYLQGQKNPKSIPVLKKDILTQYPLLIDRGDDRMLINQCGHALWSIGTKEAITVIRELAQSTNPLIKKEMSYRLGRIVASQNEP